MNIGQIQLTERCFTLVDGVRKHCVVASDGRYYNGSWLCIHCSGRGVLLTDEGIALLEFIKEYRDTIGV